MKPLSITILVLAVACMAMTALGVFVSPDEVLIFTATLRKRKRVTPADVLSFPAETKKPVELVN